MEIELKNLTLNKKTTCYKVYSAKHPAGCYDTIPKPLDKMKLLGRYRRRINEYWHNYCCFHGMPKLLTFLIILNIASTIQAKDYFETKASKLSQKEWNMLKMSHLFTELDSSLEGKTILIQDYSSNSIFNKFNLGKEFTNSSISYKSKAYNELFNNSIRKIELPIQHVIKSYDFTKLESKSDYLYLSFLSKIQDDEIVVWHVDENGFEKPIFVFDCTGLDMSDPRNVELTFSHLKGVLFGNIDGEAIELVQRSMQMSVRNLEFIRESKLERYPATIEIGNLTFGDVNNYVVPFSKSSEEYAQELNENMPSYFASSHKLGEKNYSILMTTLGENTLQLKPETLKKIEMRKFQWKHSKAGLNGTLGIVTTDLKHYTIIKLQDLETGETKYSTIGHSKMKTEFQALAAINLHVNQFHEQYSKYQTIRFNISSLISDSKFKLDRDETIDIVLNSHPYNGTFPDKEITNTVESIGGFVFKLITSDTLLTTSRYRLFLLRKTEYKSSLEFDPYRSTRDSDVLNNSPHSFVPKIETIASYCPVIYDWEMDKYFRISSQYSSIKDAIQKVHNCIE